MAIVEEDLFEDDEGNQFTEDDLERAIVAMDEEGSGMADAVSTAGTLTQEDAGAASVPELAAPPTKRELNPKRFGDFFKSNIFGGFNAKNVIGERPTTLFDFATDVISGLGGQDIAARNRLLQKTANERSTAAAQAELTEQKIKTERAKTQKTGLEAGKLGSEAVATMMANVDSDLWPKELAAIAKENAITLRPGTVAMTTRMAEKLAAAGVNSPAEVLQNPEKFDPALVNRVRHTMSILSKNVEESEKRRIETERGKQALGMRAGPEQREQAQFAQSEVGIQDAIDVIAEDLSNPDPAVRRQAKAQMAAMMEGGTARQKVFEEIGGLKEKKSGGFGVEFRGFLAQAQEELAKEGNLTPTPGEVNARAQQIKTDVTVSRGSAKKVQGQIDEGRKKLTDAMNTLNTVEDAVARLDLAEGSFSAWITQPVRMLVKRGLKNPEINAIRSIESVMGQMARSVSQEVGVLTNPDIERIKAAVKPDLGIGGDTKESYAARLGFVKEIMRRVKVSIDNAEKTGKFEPVDATDITFPGDPFPSESGQTRAALRQSETTHMTAREALEQVKGIQDPVERNTAARKLLAEVNRGR